MTPAKTCFEQSAKTMRLEVKGRGIGSSCEDVLVIWIASIAAGQLRLYWRKIIKNAALLIIL
jgi:hypothetical protein